MISIKQAYRKYIILIYEYHNVWNCYYVKLWGKTMLQRNDLFQLLVGFLTILIVFLGDDKCFLFTLAPEMNVYRTCEMNSSFIFFCNNKASEKCGVVNY